MRRPFMESMIIDREILPEPIFSYKQKPNVDDLFGMFSDGKLSSDDFIKQKADEDEKEATALVTRLSKKVINESW
jgi:hypothetical protein